MKDRHGLDSLPCTVSVVTPKAMCPMHRDTKRTKTSALGAEEGLLQSPARRMGSLCSKDPGRSFAWTCLCMCSVTQSCPALCGSVHYSLPGSSAHEIFQAKILEWDVISRGSSQPRYRTCITCFSWIGSVFFTTNTPWEAFMASVSATFPTVEVENFLGKESHKWMS